MDISKLNTLNEVLKHYFDWNEDNDQRRTRENGWNDVIDAYHGQLPDNWAYLSRVVDPRIRTTLIEKKARLTNAKLRGRLNPREGGDMLRARLNNALIDFQWDSANEGGSMNAKLGEMDIDSRMFGSSFGYVPWFYEVDKDGVVKRNGNGLTVLDPNNCGIDPNCSNIRDARWFQMREYVTLNDLERENLVPGIPKFPGFNELKRKISENQQNLRESDYETRNLTLKGIEDRLGRDEAFPVIEKVTEFRRDKFIVFCPKYNVILAEFKNPYRHCSIPIIQLRYYPLLNDPWGESEVESVIPIWRAIQATICGYLDTMNIHMRPPLKIVEGQVRMETIVWTPEATWLMNRLDAVEEHQGTGEALQFFQTTYTSLVAAFNQAMGDISQGVSAVDPFNQDKTATEVKQTAKQQNVRDENNQLYLAECITDLMRMWVMNNQQFLFADPNMHEYVLRIIGSEAFEYFKRSGLDEMTVPDEGMLAIKDIIDMRGGDMSQEEMQELYDSAKVPLHPVQENPTVRNPNKMIIKPKMRLSDLGDSAELSLTPYDLEGTYDYIPDVKSMALGATTEIINAQQKALEMLINPTIMQLLQMEGYTPNVKDLIQSNLEAIGNRDSDRYFKPLTPSPGVGADMGQPGLPGVPPAVAPGAEQMAQPEGLPQPGGFSMGVPGVMG